MGARWLVLNGRMRFERRLVLLHPLGKLASIERVNAFSRLSVSRPVSSLFFAHGGGRTWSSFVRGKKGEGESKVDWVQGHITSVGFPLVLHSDPAAESPFAGFPISIENSKEDRVSLDGFQDVDWRICPHAILVPGSPQTDPSQEPDRGPAHAQQTPVECKTFHKSASGRGRLICKCFALAFCCWSSDAIDFFCTSLSATEIAKTLDRPLKDITWGITLVLMLRSVGAIFFGLLSDRFGRRWPMIFNLFLFVVLEIGLGFVQTFKQFLAVRALFGIAMGGIYGM